MLVRTFSIVLLSVCFFGCGTILNVADRTMPPRAVLSEQAAAEQIARKEIYGGVAMDAAGGSYCLFKERDLLPGLYILCIDLPLSAVGDTLTLPITIPAFIDRSIEDYYFPERSSERNLPEENVPSNLIEQ